MKAIFLCDSNYNLERVYFKGISQKLMQHVEIEEKIYSSNDIIHSPECFGDVEFIFSTWGMPALSVDQIKSIFPSLKCVFYGAGTVQSFARPFLECGVKVFSAWAANAVPVAEYTVAQIILANKGFFTLSHINNPEERQKAANAFSSFKGNYGATVGIIGAGMIGSLVIKLLKAFYNLNIVVFDPFLSDEKANELGVTKTTLENLFAISQVTSNHLANNEQTKGMLNYSHFASMPQNAVFLNTGRGAQVVENDLVNALKEREDITAILDVTDPEPPADGHPFYSLKNCILTPHIAGSSGDEVCRMALYMLEEYLRYINNEKCLYEVTAKMLETMA